jgi:hypothetical protein
MFHPQEAHRFVPPIPQKGKRQCSIDAAIRSEWAPHDARHLNASMTLIIQNVKPGFPAKG